MRINIVHNAFRKSLEEVWETCSDLIVKVYYLFRGWHARIEDFKKPAKHWRSQVELCQTCTNPWLSIGFVAARITVQWPAFVECLHSEENFTFVFIPKKNASLMRLNAYKKIAKLLKQSTLEAEFQFIVDSSSFFSRFTLNFLREEPSVHEIITELELLVWTLAGHILEAEAAQKL
ncbi:hypothetical protein QYM36_007001 [Artemia franciscana]|uniref:Uncharacterized protein n=1 Tax=Artemia franciscana TaxID=6661 RepID=A0AA88HYX7_ARTSF|nr:hypothetical protein QYM36_007001 [Artemia franciscana]